MAVLLLARCLWACAQHPDPERRGNASSMLAWLSGQLDEPARVLRAIGEAEAAAQLHRVRALSDQDLASALHLARHALWTAGQAE